MWGGRGAGHGAVDVAALDLPYRTVHVKAVSPFAARFMGATQNNYSIERVVIGCTTPQQVCLQSVSVALARLLLWLQSGSEKQDAEGYGAKGGGTAKFLR